METRTIFFMGKPGSGKGDQAKLLSEKTGWNVIVPGAQFRAMSAEDTAVGQKMRAVNDAGLLQPHWLATYLFLKAMLPLRADEGIILDGFGRTLPEAEFILEALDWLERPFTALHLKVSDEEILNRVALRKGIEGRADDNAVEKRLEEYRVHTMPAIEVFRAAGKVVEIDGEGTREAIAEHIRKVLSI